MQIDPPTTIADRSEQAAAPIRLSAGREQAILRSYVDSIRLADRDQQRTYILRGEYSEKRCFEDREPASPLPREDLIDVVRRLNAVPVLLQSDRSGNSLTSLLSLAEGDAEPADDLAKASVEHSAVLTVADTIFDLPNAPFDRGKALPSIHATEALHLGGTCLQVELGTAAPARLARTIGDILLAVAKHRQPGGFVTVYDGKHGFYREAIPAMIAGDLAGKHLGRVVRIQQTEGEAPDETSYSTNAATGFTGDEDFVMTAHADNVERTARHYLLS